MIGEQPFISVIIPAYNAEKYLDEALQSIINQHYTPMEIIVVDDGSTDNTAEIVAEYGTRVRYVYQKNNGPPAARNKGLGLAQGNVIAFLDSDDLWSEKKLERQLKRLADKPYIEVVIGHTQRIRLLESGDDHQKFVPFLPSQPMLSLGSALIRRRAFTQVGIFDESLLFSDDIDWFLRAREEEIAITIHRDITQYYRKHNHNITNDRRLDLKYQMIVYKKSITRRRMQTVGSPKPLKNWTDFYETGEVYGETGALK